MIKYITIIILLVSLLAIPSLAIASTITGAEYYGSIIVSNNSTSTTQVSTVMDLDTDSMIDNLGVEPDISNVVIRDSSGGDVPFMPGYSTNPWCLWVPTIAEDANINYTMYTGNVTGGLIRYFPDSSGMTISDAATMELATDGYMLLDSYLYLDGGSEADIIKKADALSVYTNGSGNITFEAVGTTTGWETPTSVNDPDTQWTNDGNTIDGDTGTYASDTVGAGSWTAFLEFTLAEVNSVSNIRVWVDNCINQQIDIDVYSDGSWVNEVQQAIAQGAWVDLALSKTYAIDQYRVRIYTDGTAPRLNETQAYTGTYAIATVADIDNGEHTITAETDGYYIGLGVDKSDDTTYPVSANLTLAAPLWYEAMGSSPFTTLDAAEHTCTVTGATHSATSGYTFDGSGDLIATESFSINFNTCTVAVWIKPTDLASRDAYFSSSNTANQWLLEIGSGLVGQGNNNCFAILNPGINVELITSNDTVTQDIWQMVTVAKADNITAARGYVNDSEVSRQASNALDFSSTASTAKELGRRSAGSEEFTGSIGEWFIYERCLTEEQIGDLYDATKWKYTGADEQYSYDYFGGTIDDNSEDWIIGGDATPYIEYYKHYVSDTLKSHIEWEYDSTFTDLSGNSNDATPTFRTASSDADVSAALAMFLPFSLSTYSTTSSTWGQILTDAPDQPDTTYTETDRPGFFFEPIVHAILSLGGIPDSFFWYNFCFFIIIIVGMIAYRIHPSLAIKGTIMAAVMIFFATEGLNVYGMYVIFYFALASIGIILISRSYGL